QRRQRRRRAAVPGPGRQVSVAPIRGFWNNQARDIESNQPRAIPEPTRRDHTMAVESKELSQSPPLLPGTVMSPVGMGPSAPPLHTQILIDLPPEAARQLNQLMEE